MPTIHFIGIGGVGMNGLAQLAALSGHCVSGSDRGYTPEAEVFQALENLDIRIFPQDGSGLSPATDIGVYSTAIESTNPDLQQAQALGIPLLHRAEFLKYLIGHADLIAVAGTAGKTTTTGLLGWIFQCLEKDPTVYNGAAVLNWKKAPTLGNIRKGSSNLWIIEADESDKSFLNFQPTHSIITNISKDHYELDELNRMFNQFESQTSEITIRGSSFSDFFSNGFLFEGIKFTLPMLGKHNLENALCAVRLCSKLGMDMERVRDAVANFQGIERRLEIAGKVDGITVIDDYAHNPAKIAAALAAATQAFGQVRAFWRPHGFTPLFQGMDDLIETFKTAHPASLFILPVYYAGGTVNRKTSSAELVERLNAAGVTAQLVPDYTTLKHQLEHNAKPGDAILGMGARDPKLPLFAKQLVTQWKIS
jgi:UDP-N-acetylmuramate--alanine ligase